MSTGIALLDVAIGVLFAVLTFSLIASSLQEALASVLNWRGRMLRRGLFRLLETAADADALIGRTRLSEDTLKRAKLTFDVLNDPSITALHGSKSFLGRAFDVIMPKDDRLEKSGRVPSAIPRESFAKALLDSLHRRIKDDISPLADAAEEHAGAVLTETRAKFETAREDALNQAQAAFNKQVENGIKPDDPHTVADNVVRATLGTITPEIAFAKAYVTSLGKSVDKALGAVDQTIAALPMDQDLQARLRKAVRQLAVSRALADRLDGVSHSVEGAQAELTRMIQDLEAQANQTAEAVAQWFDRGMDRVSGWYVRRAKYVLFLLGMLMAATVNFDIIGYAGQLMKNENLRNQIVARAEAAADKGAVGGLNVSVKTPLTPLAGKIDTDRSGKIQREELQAYRFTPQDLAALGLPAESAPDGKLADNRIGTATDRLNDSLIAVDTNGDGVITAEEVTAAVDATLKKVSDRVDLSLATINTQLGGDGLTFGWTCKPRPEGGWFVCSVLDCIWNGLSLTSVLSWFLIGMGCTLGGQFWFDVMKRVIGVRASAAGLNSDIKQMMSQVRAKPDAAGEPPA